MTIPDVKKVSEQRDAVPTTGISTTGGGMRRNESLQNLLLRRHPEPAALGSAMTSRKLTAHDLSLFNFGEEEDDSPFDWRWLIGGSATLMALLNVAVHMMPFGEDVTAGLGDIERQAVLLALTMQVTSLLQDTLTKQVLGSSDSGLRGCVLGIKVLAALTNLAIYAFPAQRLLLDHITGRPQCMLRWVEWTVLAYTMTFLVEVSDGTPQKEAVRSAASQGLSTACAILLPLCPSLLSWLPTLVASFVLYSFIYRRLYVKTARLRHLRASLPAASYELRRVELGVRLLKLCVLTWTVRICTRIPSKSPRSASALRLRPRPPLLPPPPPFLARRLTPSRPRVP